MAIFNFITPGTVDAEIYERCLLRIGVFRQALGGSEEILGKLTREIRSMRRKPPADIGRAVPPAPAACRCSDPVWCRTDDS